MLLEFINFCVFIVAVFSFIYVLLVKLYPDTTLYDDVEQLHTRIKPIKQHDTELKHLVEPDQSVSIDTTFILGLTEDYENEINNSIKILTSYKQIHPNYNIQIIVIFQTSGISNRSLIRINTQICQLLMVCSYSPRLTKADLFRSSILKSKGNIVFVIDFYEFHDLSPFNTFLSALGKNHRQMIIGVRPNSKDIFSSFEHRIFKIFKTDDNFLVTRLLTKEAAHRIFANSHINDKFFTVEANRLGKLEHCKVRQVYINNGVAPPPPIIPLYLKVLRVIQISIFYNINIWSYHRMHSSFQTQYGTEEV